MKKLLIILVLFPMLISFDSYGGWFGITSIEDATCKDLEKKAKGQKLTNAFGGKFKILQVKNSKEISRTKDKLVCIGDLKLDSGFSNSKLLMTLIDEDGEIWYEFKQEINSIFDNNIESDSQNAGEIISRSTIFEDVLSCKKIIDNDFRLGCYDSLSNEFVTSKTITYDNGDRYVGEWRNDKRNGQGTLTYANGDKYVGEFKNDNKNGQGTYTYAMGNKYVGEFKNDAMNGQGTYTYVSGDRYVGEYENNLMNGQGIVTYANGNKYVGEYKNNKKNGQGTFTYTNGDRYVGEYKNNLINGQGTYTFADGEVAKGIWENNNLVEPN